MTKFITSQNIEIEHELAGLGDRLVAFIIDILINAAFFIFMVSFLITVLNDLEPVVVGIIFLPWMFYSLAFEAFGNGQTPGKRARNIRVVKLDGGSPRFGHYLIRWIMRPVDFIFYGAIAIVCIMMTKNGQRLGDILAGTTVARMKAQVSLSDVKSVFSNDHQIVFPQVKQLNDRQIELMRRALHMRRDGFSEEGVQELAEKLKALLKIDTQMADVQFLYTLIKDYEYYSNQS